jgi:hypothetical protein
MAEHLVQLPESHLTKMVERTEAHYMKRRPAIVEEERKWLRSLFRGRELRLMSAARARVEERCLRVVDALEGGLARGGRRLCMVV